MRIAFQQTVAAVQIRETSTRAELDIYRAEMGNTLARASPEMLEALQLFADGEFERAWPLIAAETEAHAIARDAASAAEFQTAANLRETMRINGQASIQDVLILWNRAAQYDNQGSNIHYQRAVLLRTQNRLADAQSAAEAALASARTDRERSSALVELGTIMVTRRNLTGALSSFRDALAIDRRLVAGDSEDWRLRHNLAVVLMKIGEVLGTLRDTPGALASHQEALSIRRQLLASRPNETLFASDVAVSLMAIGENLISSGDTGTATERYQEAISLMTRAATLEPNNIELVHYASLARFGLAKALRQSGDVRGGRRQFREALPGLRRTLAADPSNVLMARDYILVQKELAISLMMERDYAGALTLLQEILEMARRLAAADSSNLEWSRDVVSSLEGIGEILETRNDRVGAIAHYREALQVVRRWEDTSSEEIVRLVWGTMFRLAFLSEIPWADVVAAIEAAQRRGLFDNEHDGLFLQIARARANESGAH